MKILLLLVVVYFVNGKEFQFLNKWPRTIWMGSQGLSNGSYTYPPLENGGWIQAPGEMKTVIPPSDDWQGNIWVRTGCNATANECITGECDGGLHCTSSGTPPITLANFYLKAGQNGRDLYDISVIYGFNVPISIQPIDGESDGSLNSCGTPTCSSSDVLLECPPLLQFEDDSNVVGCYSSCSAYNREEVCCTGPYGSEDTCQPSTWLNSINSVRFFNALCPQAYTYNLEEQINTYNCNATAYLITVGEFDTNM